MIIITPILSGSSELPYLSSSMLTSSFAQFHGIFFSPDYRAQPLLANAHDTSRDGVHLDFINTLLLFIQFMDDKNERDVLCVRHKIPVELMLHVSDTPVYIEKLFFYGCSYLPFGMLLAFSLLRSNRKHPSTSIHSTVLGHRLDLSIINVLNYTFFRPIFCKRKSRPNILTMLYLLSVIYFPSLNLYILSLNASF